jgi:uncharacterized phage protein (TIGR02220 family)
MSDPLKDLPEPLTPVDCDLRHLPCMLLDVVRLCDSDLATLLSGEEFRSAVLLWCKSWHQVPAASLPDDDRVLSQLAGFGRVVSEWLKVKHGAMRGWIKCSDGRWYHSVVAEKANEALSSTFKHEHEKLAGRIRKSGKKLVVPTLEQWIAAGRPSESELFPLEGFAASAGKQKNSAGKSKNSSGTPSEFQPTSPGIPTENPLKVKEGNVKEVNLKTLVGQNPPDESDSQPEENAPPGPEAVQTEFSLTAEQPADAAAEELSAPDVAAGIINYLNEKTGHSYKPAGANLKFVRARLSAGATEEQCLAVIDAKAAEWMGKDQEKYLRPETLFNETKFASYSGQLGARVPAQSLPPKSRHDLSGMDYSSRRTDGLPF